MRLRIVCSICCLLLCVIVVPAVGQKFSLHSIKILGRESDRMSALLREAQRLIILSEELAASESQKLAFKDLQKQANEVFQRKRRIFNLPPGEEQRKFLDEILTAFREIEDELREEILLPHQMAIFKRAFFDRLLDRHHDSYCRLIKAHLLVKLDLSREQREEFEKLRQSIYQEKEKIRQECKNRIAEIEASSQKKYVEFLTAEQIERIEKLAGKKMGEVDKDLERRMLGFERANDDNSQKAQTKDKKSD